MDLQDGIETSESRFAAYVETLASALGHADRVAPLKAYCTGLLLPGDRKSVEPMAARVEPVVSRRRTSLCITSWRKRTGRTMPCLASCGRRFCRPLSVRGRSAPGSSATPAFPRKVSIRSVWRGSIAANSASRTTAKIPWGVNSGRRSGKVRLR